MEIYIGISENKPRNEWKGIKLGQSNDSPIHEKYRVGTLWVQRDTHRERRIVILTMLNNAHRGEDIRS